MSTISDILQTVSPIFQQIFGNSFSQSYGNVPVLPGYQQQVTQQSYGQTVYNPQQQTQGAWYGNTGGSTTDPSAYWQGSGQSNYYQGQQMPWWAQYLGFPRPIQNQTNLSYLRFSSEDQAKYVLTNAPYNFTARTEMMNFADAYGQPGGGMYPAVTVPVTILRSPGGQEFRLQSSGSGYYQQIRVVPYQGKTNLNSQTSSQMWTNLQRLTGKSEGFTTQDFTNLITQSVGSGNVNNAAAIQGFLSANPFLGLTYQDVLRTQATNTAQTQGMPGSTYMPNLAQSLALAIVAKADRSSISGDVATVPDNAISNQEFFAAFPVVSPTTIDLTQINSQIANATEFGDKANPAAGTLFGILKAAGYDFTADVASPFGLVDGPSRFLVKERATGKFVLLEAGGYRAPGSGLAAKLSSLDNTKLSSTLDGMAAADARAFLGQLGFGEQVNIVADPSGLTAFSHADGRVVKFKDNSTATSINGISNVIVTGGATSSTLTDAQLRARLVGQTSAQADLILRNELGFQAIYPAGGWGSVSYVKDGRSINLVTDRYTSIVTDLRISGGSSTGTLPANLANGINVVGNGVISAQQQLDATMNGLGYTLIPTQAQGLGNRQYRSADGRIFQSRVENMSGYNFRIGFTEVTGTSNTALPAELAQPLSFYDLSYYPAQNQLDQRMTQMGYAIERYNIPGAPYITGTQTTYSKNGRSFIAERNPVTTMQYPPRATFTFREVTNGSGTGTSQPPALTPDANGLVPAAQVAAWNSHLAAVLTGKSQWEAQSILTQSPYNFTPAPTPQGAGVPTTFFKNGLSITLQLSGLLNSTVSGVTATTQSTSTTGSGVIVPANVSSYELGPYLVRMTRSQAHDLLIARGFTQAQGYPNSYNTGSGMSAYGYNVTQKADGTLDVSMQTA